MYLVTDNYGQSASPEHRRLRAFSNSSLMARGYEFDIYPDQLKDR